MVEQHMMSADHLTAREAAALLAFFADAGVECLMEDEAANLMAAAEMADAAPPRQERAAPSRQAPPRERPQPAASIVTAPGAQTTVPDDKAVSDARFAAESARSLPELRTVLEGFGGCNLRHNARSTIALEGLPETGIMAVCGFPTGDDDRAGEAMSGKAGRLFELMLSAIDLSRDAVGVTTAIPWRTPGDRAPTPSETDICLPFLERQIALAEPKLLLVLGNFASRMLIDRQKTVFDLRGQWQTLQIGGSEVTALVSFAPSELLAAPANKKLAWQDLLAFRKALG